MLGSRKELAALAMTGFILEEASLVLDRLRQWIQEGRGLMCSNSAFRFPTASGWLLWVQDAGLHEPIWPDLAVSSYVPSIL